MRALTPSTIAVAATLRQRAVDRAMVGFRRADQIDPMLGATNLELTDESLDQIVGAK